MLRLANRDQSALLALLAATDVAPSVALFHAQQAAEKSLKAVMCLRGLEYRRTHDLEELAAQLKDAGCGPPVDPSILRRLTPYAVEYRYDDEAPQLLGGAEATAIVAVLLLWAESQEGPGIG